MKQSHFNQLKLQIEVINYAANYAVTRMYCYNPQKWISERSLSYKVTTSCCNWYDLYKAESLVYNTHA